MRKEEARARATAHIATLLRQHPANKEEAAHKWLDAEYVVDSFIQAVQAGSGDLPERQQVGEACLVLISISDQLLNAHNVELVQDLLMLDIGLNMTHQLPRVLKLKAEAVATLELLAKPQQPIAAEPFEDLF